jgi:hypothetical protein
MLAYYVERHMREAWRELMFADTEQQDSNIDIPRRQRVDFDEMTPRLHIVPH